MKSEDLKFEVGHKYQAPTHASISGGCTLISSSLTFTVSHIDGDGDVYTMDALFEGKRPTGRPFRPNRPSGWTITSQQYRRFFTEILTPPPSNVAAHEEHY